uniref:Uncharacterized protein n=1 Tax=Romanomermis culicivorax TaxID=13658 RepID=A0A915I9I9_ROMCU
MEMALCGITVALLLVSFACGQYVDRFRGVSLNMFAHKYIFRQKILFSELFFGRFRRRNL